MEVVPGAAGAQVRGRGGAAAATGVRLQVPGGGSWALRPAVSSQEPRELDCISSVPHPAPDLVPGRLSKCLACKDVSDPAQGLGHPLRPTLAFPMRFRKDSGHGPGWAAVLEQWVP